MRAPRTRLHRGCAQAPGLPLLPGPRRASARRERPGPVLRYRLVATYDVLPACDQHEVEDVLDRVSADLHPHDVRLWSLHGGVHVVVQVEDDDVLEVYARVAAALERVVVALRRHWPCPPDDGAEVTILLMSASQSFR